MRITPDDLGRWWLHSLVVSCHRNQSYVLELTSHEPPLISMIYSRLNPLSGEGVRITCDDLWGSGYIPQLFHTTETIVIYSLELMSHQPPLTSMIYVHLDVSHLWYDFKIAVCIFRSLTAPCSPSI